MCNLASHPEALKNFRKKDKMKTWVALAEDYESDVQTSKAAIGALAMAASDEGDGVIIVVLVSYRRPVLVSTRRLPCALVQRWPK